MTAPRVIPTPETEDGFQGWVLDLAGLRGWETYHTRFSFGSARGWPDLILCRPPRLVAAEIKSQKGRTTTAQWKWLSMLADCPGVETYLWRPADRDEIEIVLGRDDALAASVRRHPARRL